MSESEWLVAVWRTERFSCPFLLDFLIAYSGPVGSAGQALMFWLFLKTTFVK